MKLASIGLARSIWLFPFVELNPKGLSLLPCYNFLLERYNFLKFPKGEELRTQQQYKFEDGSFLGPQGQRLWVNLSVYSDGIVVDTRSSTEDSDHFQQEVLTSISQEFGFASHEKILRKKLYSSEVFIEMERGFSIFNSKFETFLHQLQALVTTDNSIKFEVAGISFQQDPAKINGTNAFRLERALNAPHGDNRYYSIASMPTQAHVQMLEKLETILGGAPL